MYGPELAGDGRGESVECVRYFIRKLAYVGDRIAVDVSCDAFMLSLAF